MIRVLVAEDSSPMREYLVHLLESDPALEVVAAARDGEEAVELTERLRPDVIVMDIEMPRMDGYEATRRIMERVPTPIVMASGHSSETEDKAFEALRAGALVLLSKVLAPTRPKDLATTRDLVATVKLMAEVKVVRRWPRRDVVPEPTRRIEPAGEIRVVAIGASAGGPPILAQILAELPASFGCPILVVQHISPGFVEGLAEWLGRAASLAVKVAEPDEPTYRGTVYLAPDGVQMGVGKDGRVRLSTERAEDGFCPSASYLLRSIAASYGPAAIGVLLTGMGRDGAAGLLELRNAGGVTIAQDKESSAIFGMPMEAIRLGAAEHVLPPKRIAEAVSALVDGRRRAASGARR